MKNDTAIFDLDGVLVDTAKYHYLAWKRLAHELGFDLSPEVNERQKGVSRMRSLEILLEVGGISVSETEKLRLSELKNKWYVEYIDLMTPDEILPGVLEFLQALKENGIKTALGSASKNANTILEKTKLRRFFSVVVDGNVVSKAKPDPEVFLKAAELIGAIPETCVVFEDSIAGVEAAGGAGIVTVGIGNTENLKNATKVVENFTVLNNTDFIRQYFSTSTIGTLTCKSIIS